MTKDKTVTMSRELAERLAHVLYMHDAENTEAATELDALIAAPVVERQDAPFYISMSDWNTLVRDDVEIASVRISRTKRSVFTEPLHASPPAPVAVRITLQQVLKAYDYAESHPHKYLRGTTNWCAAVAHELNACLDKVKELNQ